MVKAQDLQDLLSTNCNEVEMKRFNDTMNLTRLLHSVV